MLALVLGLITTIILELTLKPRFNYVFGVDTNHLFLSYGKKVRKHLRIF